MKTIAILILFLSIGINAQAQTSATDVKSDTVEMTIITESSFEEAALEANAEVARLYKRIDTRVKKELTFTTKANRAKMA